MAIGWAHSDGSSGVYDNPTEAVMERPVQTSKSDREELPPQERINQAFGEGPAAPEIKDQNAPNSWGMGEDMKSLGTLPDAPEAEWEKSYGPNRSWKEQLASFQQRLDTTPPEEAGAFRKFLGSLNIMPTPGKPESEWTAKEHFGVLLNTAMAGMGGGIRVPKITGPGFGKRPPIDFNYPMDFKDYYPANNMNKPIGQIEPSNLDEFVNNAWEGLRKQFTPGTYEHAVANQIAQKGKLKIVPKEEGLTTETEPQLQQAQHMARGRTPFPRTEGMKASIQDMIDAGKTRTEIKTELGVSSRTFANLQKDFELDMPYAQRGRKPNAEAGVTSVHEYPHVVKAYEKAVAEGYESQTAIQDAMLRDGTPVT